MPSYTVYSESTTPFEFDSFDEAYEEYGRLKKLNPDEEVYLFRSVSLKEALDKGRSIFSAELSRARQRTRQLEPSRE